MKNFNDRVKAFQAEVRQRSRENAIAPALFMWIAWIRLTYKGKEILLELFPVTSGEQNWTDESIFP